MSIWAAIISMSFCTRQPADDPLRPHRRLVDAPRAGDNGRPYWTAYTPRDILGHRSEIIDGQQKLTQLRLHEQIVVPEGLYGQKQIEQVRVLTPGGFEIHQKDDNGDFKIVDEGQTSLDEIPFAVAYSNRVGLLESRPPLADIAELNLKAYQTQSDLDNMLHISAVPMLALFGFPQQQRRSAQAQAKR